MPVARLAPRDSQHKRIAGALPGVPDAREWHATGATHRAQHCEKTACEGFPSLGIAL